MKFFPSALTLAFLAATSATVSAEEVKFSLGGGIYSTTHEFKLNYKEQEFSGIGLTATAAFSNHLGARVNVFTTENDKNSRWEASGVDILALAGFNLTAIGFKAYAGAGFFRETWEERGLEESFTGPQFSVGLGYNWEQVSVDYMLNLRNTSDYEGMWFDTRTGREAKLSSVNSSMLSVSYRF